MSKEAFFEKKLVFDGTPIGEVPFDCLSWWAPIEDDSPPEPLAGYRKISKEEREERRKSEEDQSKGEGKSKKKGKRKKKYVPTTRALPHLYALIEYRETFIPVVLFRNKTRDSQLALIDELKPLFGLAKTGLHSFTMSHALERVNKKDKRIYIDGKCNLQFVRKKEYWYMAKISYAILSPSGENKGIPEEKRIPENKRIPEEKISLQEVGGQLNEVKEFSSFNLENRSQGVERCLDDAKEEKEESPFCKSKELPKVCPSESMDLSRKIPIKDRIVIDQRTRIKRDEIFIYQYKICQYLLFFHLFHLSTPPFYLCQKKLVLYELGKSGIPFKRGEKSRRGRMPKNVETKFFRNEKKEKLLLDMIKTKERFYYSLRYEIEEVIERLDRRYIQLSDIIIEKLGNWLNL